MRTNSKLPSDTKVHLLKRFHPSDSFCTFFSESVEAVKRDIIIRTLECSKSV